MADELINFEELPPIPTVVLWETPEEFPPLGHGGA